MNKQLWQVFRWFAAEFVGTLLLAMTAGISILAHTSNFSGYTSLYFPMAIGLVIMVLVYLIGPVSGAHFNPAVSVALFAFRHIRISQLVTHILAQLAGAYIGFLLVLQMISTSLEAPTAMTRGVVLGEFFGTFLLVFAVTSVVLGRVKAELGGIVIGAALTIGLTLSVATQGGVLNPAIATALGAFNLTYIGVPLLGGLVGAALATLFQDHRA
jgi:glycerol uptake facilitator-like aquaporin